MSLPDVAILDDDYNAQSGSSSTPLAEAALVTDADLSGVNLFIGYYPNDAYTAAEISAMSAFLASGGSLLFTGDNGSFATPQNGHINTAIAAPGFREWAWPMAPRHHRTHPSG